MHEKQKPLDERWGSYPETVCFFQSEPEVMVDLRVEVPPATRKDLAALGLGQPFGIVTAFNPRGVELGDQENSRRAEKLESELSSLGLHFVAVDCCSPDRSHCEYSLAVVAPLNDLLAMARRWEQVAIFWWDGQAFWLNGAIRPGELRLPVQL